MKQRYEKYGIYAIYLIFFSIEIFAQKFDLLPSSAYIFNNKNNHLNFYINGVNSQYSTVLFDNIPINSNYDNLFNLKNLFAIDNRFFNISFADSSRNYNLSKNLSIDTKIFQTDTVMLLLNGGNTGGNAIYFQSFNYNYYYINLLMNYNADNGIIVSNEKTLPYNISNNTILNSASNDLSFFIKTGLKDKNSEFSISNFFNSNFNEYPLNVYKEKNDKIADNNWHFNLTNIRYFTSIYDGYLTGNIYYKYSRNNKITEANNISNYETIEENTMGFLNEYSINSANNYDLNVGIDYNRRKVDKINHNLYTITNEYVKLLVKQQYKLGHNFLLGINTGYYINSFNSSIKNKYNLSYSDFNYNMFAQYNFIKNGFCKFDISYNSQSPTIKYIYADIFENANLIGIGNLLNSNNYSFEFNYKFSENFSIFGEFFISNLTNLPEVRADYISTTSNYQINGVNIELLMDYDVISVRLAYSKIASSIEGNYYNIENNLIFPENNIIIDFHKELSIGLAYHLKINMVSERIDYNYEFGVNKILKDFYNISFNISQKFRGNSSVFIEVVNFLDNYYETFHGFPQNGLCYKAGINLIF